MIWIFRDDNFQFFSISSFFELTNVNFIRLFYYTILSILHITNEETDEATFLHYIAYKSLHYLCRAQLHIAVVF